jgi:hypothetical protein
MTELLGRDVVESLYTCLEKHHDITKDELPYRLETAYSVLENVFGVKGARTIGTRIARRLYQKLNLPFASELGYTPVEYVNIAKKKLGMIK